MIPPLLQQQVQAELRPGEKLIWSGQPLPQLHRWNGIGMMIPGLACAVFAVFSVVNTWRELHAGPEGGGFHFVHLITIPFAIAAIILLASPIWLRRIARRTIYALTDRRAIIIEGQFFGQTKIETFAPDRLASITREDRRDGSGDIIFETYVVNAGGSNSKAMTRGFLAIENVREVEDKMLTTLLDGKTRAA